jgi:hypothetical protein
MPANKPAAPQPSRLEPLVFPVLFAAIAAALQLQQIDLSIVDLGRHLKNGEILLTAAWADKWALLHTNYYSYTEGATPFVNHHWLTGVVFFAVWKLISFDGLSLLHAALLAVAVVFSYRIARRDSSWTIAAPLMALALPNIVWRAEVRPESFTYLLTIVFYGVLLNWHEGRLSNRGLFVLPALMLAWVNLHIGFVFGFLLIAVFGLKTWVADSATRMARLRQLAWVGALCVAAGLLNPSGLAGFAYPLSIFREYGYPIAENLAITELRARQLWSWQYTLFLLLLGTAAALALMRWLDKQRGGPPRWPEFALLAATGLLALVMVRNIPVFCLLFVPVATGLIAERPLPRARPGASWAKLAALVGCAAGLICAAQQFRERATTAGIGLAPNVNGAAEFLRANSIRGPYWNDVDIGGYLIFHFFSPASGERVFVDGRPEAYPADFFTRGYLPMLFDKTVWWATDDKYRFNALVYSLQDGYPGIERSILERVRDANWAPVYTDFYSLIFVRRTPENAAVIEKHLIPRDRFR